MLLINLDLFVHPVIGFSIHQFAQTYSTFHLFLSQNEDSSRFDRMPGSQSLSPSLQLSPLVGLPHAISKRPADTDVLPLVLW